MPRALARVDGENTRLRPGYCAHQPRSTSSPNAVSAAPNGRGSAAGSTAATPRVTAAAGAGAGAAALAHPARAAVTLAAVRTPKPVLLPSRMPLGRRPSLNGSRSYPERDGT